MPRPPRSSRRQLLWPPFFPEVVYDSTGVFDGGSVDNEDIVENKSWRASQPSEWVNGCNFGHT